MSREYPKKFLLKEIIEENLSDDDSLWMSSRGFMPPNPLTYESNLVIPLYNPDGYMVSKQLRDVNDENVDTKYSLTNNVYDLLVKTTPENIRAMRVICEGTLDCLLLRMNCINAFTTLGLKAYRLKKVFEELEERVIIIFDNDTAGNYAAKKYGKYAMRYSVPAHYKDVCDFHLRDKIGFEKWLNRLMDLTLL